MMPRLGRDLVDLPVDDVQLLLRRGAQAVDQHRHLVARWQGHVGQDRLDERASAIASAGSSLPRRTPGSPWMPMPISISSSPMVKVGRPGGGHGAGRERHAHRAGVGDGLLGDALDLVQRRHLLGLGAGELVGEEDARPRRAGAPPGPCGAEATSSAASTVSTRMPSMSAISAAMPKFITSPE